VSATYLSKLFFLLDSRFQRNSTPVNSSNLLAQEYQERRERERVSLRSYKKSWHTFTMHSMASINNSSNADRRYYFIFSRVKLLKLRSVLAVSTLRVRTSPSLVQHGCKLPVCVMKYHVCSNTS
jgi:hypothetical protein